MKFRKTKSGVTICPFFIWTSENIFSPEYHDENDVNLTLCDHPENPNNCEGNCSEEKCPLIKR